MVNLGGGLRGRSGVEHGEFVSASFGQVIAFAARGPWNDETLRRGSREMGELIAKLDHSRPWCQISCLYGESLMTPTVNAYFKKQCFIRRSLGLSVLAIVIRDSDISTTIQQQLSEAYSAAEIDYEFLPTIPEAINALELSGFELDIDSLNAFFVRNDFSL